MTAYQKKDLPGVITKAPEIKIPDRPNTGLVGFGNQKTS